MAASRPASRARRAAELVSPAVSLIGEDQLQKRRVRQALLVGQGEPLGQGVEHPPEFELAHHTLKVSRDRAGDNGFGRHAESPPPALAAAGGGGAAVDDGHRVRSVSGRAAVFAGAGP